MLDVPSAFFRGSAHPTFSNVVPAFSEADGLRRAGETRLRRLIGVKPRAAWLLITLLAFVTHASAEPPGNRMAALRHGVNITGWFRFPASRDPSVLRAWLSDRAMRDLRGAGFTFVRLAVDPDLLQDRRIAPLLVESAARLQRAGLAVVVSLHPNGWRLETSPDDRMRLRMVWRVLARALRPLDAALTFPEVLNEPVFPNDPAGWATLQHEVLDDIRAVLPDHTVVLTGQDWGSVEGLLKLAPEVDPNVVYSFHFYDPAELTALAAYRPGLDRAALARLPFPVDDVATCQRVADSTTDDATRGLMRFYCASGWDGARIAATVARAAAWARQHHAALLAGEFGASAALNQPARLAWLRSARESFEAAGIGWALWGYDDVMGFALTRPPVRRPVLNPGVLAALGRAASN